MNTVPVASEGSFDVIKAIARQEVSLSRQLEWIKAVDGKIPIVVGLAIAMLAAIGALAPAPARLTWESCLYMALGFLPIGTSLAWCAAATSPQTEGPEGSLVYFGGISALQLETFADRVTSRTDQAYLDDLNAQCHRNAQIAKAKYRSVQSALRWLYGGTPLWLLSAYLLYKG